MIYRWEGVAIQEVLVGASLGPDARHFADYGTQPGHAYTYVVSALLADGSELRSLYAHNSDLLAREGQRVDRGQTIARVGRTGNASTEHVHFEVRRNDVPVDPLHYLTRPTEGTR